MLLSRFLLDFWLALVILSEDEAYVWYSTRNLRPRSSIAGQSWIHEATNSKMSVRSVAKTAIRRLPMGERLLRSRRLVRNAKRRARRRIKSTIKQQPTIKRLLRAKRVARELPTRPPAYSSDGLAVFLAKEITGLLIGESASKTDRAKITDAICSISQVSRCGSLLTMHMGPDEILVNIDVEFVDNLSTDEVEAAIDKMELRVKEAVPEAKKIYIEAQALKKGGPTPPVIPDESG